MDRAARAARQTHCEFCAGKEILKINGTELRSLTTSILSQSRNLAGEDI